MSTLTAKQRAYAAARASGLTRKESAIKAGYAEASASVAANRLEKTKQVAEAIERMKNPPPPRAEKTAGKLAEKAKCKRGYSDPLAFMSRLMDDESEEPKLRLDAAKALASFTVTKKSDQTQAEKRQERAASATSVFAPMGAPQLKAVK